MWNTKALCDYNCCGLLLYGIMSYHKHTHINLLSFACIIEFQIDISNVTAWLWGDPHIRTLDGRRYTFNGLGEYIFANVNGTFETQARTKLAAENTTATIFSAFAAADLASGSDRVQVYTHTHT